jgi:predicted dehydrogenase
MGKDPVSVYGVLQKGVWSKEVDDYFFSILKFDCDTVCQIEVSNNSQLDMPRWFVIGSKGTLIVKGKHEPVWNDAEITFENEYGKKELVRIDMKAVCESGMEGGFYEDLVPFLESRKKEFVSMYEASKVVKVLEMIQKSSNENRVVEFEE